MALARTAVGAANTFLAAFLCFYDISDCKSEHQSDYSEYYIIHINFLIVNYRVYFIECSFCSFLSALRQR